jgi:hypothetical protein
MHKSYQPILPTSNRILQKKWDDKYYSEHRILVILLPNFFMIFIRIFQVRDARPSVDTRPPKTYMHLHMKLKKFQVNFGFLCLLILNFFFFYLVRRRTYSNN